MYVVYMISECEEDLDVNRCYEFTTLKMLVKFPDGRPLNSR